MNINNLIIMCVLIKSFACSYLFLTFHISSIRSDSSRQKRYLLFTEDTQWGVFVTLAVPLHPKSLVSQAWFFEANYYTVDNATWFDPLLGDIEVSKSKEKRSSGETHEIITRKRLYTLIAIMLEKHGYPGAPCLLRAICENAEAHFLHNGILGDILHLILTPSTSMSEEHLEDFYYEAEYLGKYNKCEYYNYDCPMSPLEYLSIIYGSIL